MPAFAWDAYDSSGRSPALFHAVHAVLIHSQPDLSKSYHVEREKVLRVA